MALYARLADTALRLLTKYGTDATLGLGDAARVVKSVRNKDIKYQREDSKINVGDVEFLVDASANPREGERFTVGSDRYVVIQVVPIKPGDTIVLWYLYGRIG